MTVPRLTFLLDVDNTLLDNDAAKAELDRRLRDHLGDGETERFWRVYEAVRHDLSLVSYPETLARFAAETARGSAPAPEGAEARRRRYALADLVVTFPYDRFLYPEALAAVAHLRTLGRVAVLSDGDPAYQPSKIARAGLDAAVEGFVLVYAHKEDHLREITAAFPADHYVLVEDKPETIAKVRAALAALGATLTGVLVRQGKYAAAAGDGDWPGADLTLARIGRLRELTAADFAPR